LTEQVKAEKYGEEVNVAYQYVKWHSRINKNQKVTTRGHRIQIVLENG